ncbi:site-2 protease family protein [archaeon]|jgi:membrane-associated protease RseP (regulator of RpoE activity)|nr:site-2 protease family protein [archaeon]MBT6697775.1 site-2 protease family protein [archaeon]
MVEAVIDFILRYKAIILFYLAILIFVYLHKTKIDFQAKIIMLYRTSFGIKAMKWASKRYGEWIKLVGYVAAGVGFIGMIFITYTLIQNLIKLLIEPAAQSGVALILPGVNIPGLGVLPFWHWLISIFVIALIHEFGHGIVAKAHGVKIHNTGFVLIGPIIGAFVEPDEKQMAKQSDIVNYSILGAGPFANVLLAGLAILLLSFVFNPIHAGMLEETGFTFETYAGELMPTEIAGIPLKTTINSINGETTTTFQDFASVLQCEGPGDTITVTGFATSEDNTELGETQDYNITLTNNPDDVSRPFLGISTISNDFQIKEAYQTGLKRAWYEVINWLVEFSRWTFILSLGIGLFNLLPLPIVDGGKMAQIFLRKLKGKVKGDHIYSKISVLLLFILLFSLLLPLIKKLFGFIF